MEGKYKIKKRIGKGLQIVGSLSLLALITDPLVKTEFRQSVPIEGVNSHVEVVKERSLFGLNNKDYVEVDGEYLGDINRSVFQYDENFRLEETEQGGYVVVPSQPYFTIRPDS